MAQQTAMLDALVTVADVYARATPGAGRARRFFVNDLRHGTATMQDACTGLLNKEVAKVEAMHGGYGFGNVGGMFGIVLLGHFRAALAGRA